MTMKFKEFQKDSAIKSYRVEYRNTAWTKLWSFYDEAASFDTAKKMAEDFCKNLYGSYEIRIVEYIQSFKILETHKGQCVEEDNHGDNTLQASC